jgi:hypothetical protein
VIRWPNEKPIRLYHRPAGGWGDLVKLSTDGVECSLRNFRVVGPAKLLALRTNLRWRRSTRMIPPAKGIPIRISAQEKRHADRVSQAIINMEREQAVRPLCWQ